ncbi:MAG: hypothetical protein LBO09_05910 [Candidatus Peribacteria bacterium]|jgi:hypothetical protein|nr:hypothetical protein [Candidatus Peribacteria bacterium]
MEGIEKTGKNISHSTSGEQALLEGLTATKKKVENFDSEKRILAPVHNLVVNEIYELEENNKYLAILNVPEGFNRPHIAGLNFEKISIELIREINRLKGKEKEFPNVFLSQSSYECKKEIKDVRNMQLVLTREKDTTRMGLNIQEWSFELNNKSMY